MVRGCLLTLSISIVFFYPECGPQGCHLASSLFFKNIFNRVDSKSAVKIYAFVHFRDDFRFLQPFICLCDLTGVRNRLDTLTPIKGTDTSAMLPIKECARFKQFHIYTEGDIKGVAFDVTLKKAGPFLHLGRGLFISTAEDAVMKAQALNIDSAVEEDFLWDIAGLIWPATTMATYRSPRGMNSHKSPFHLWRIDIACGE